MTDEWPPDESAMIREPAWLLAAVDQHLARIKGTVGTNLDRLTEVMPIITTPLTEPAPGASKEEMERWERVCDNCGTYVEEGVIFFTGSVQRTIGKMPVLIFFGCCRTCKDA